MEVIDSVVLSQDIHRITMMAEKKSIFTEPNTQLAYYTGYSYATLYDWDQYFEGIIQLYMGHGTTLLKNALEIFLYLQKPNGHIQRSTDSKDCYKAQLSEHVKPFLAQSVLLIYRHDGTLDFLRDDMYDKLKKYLLYWLLDRDPNGNSLSAWDSAPHTGMDNQHERAGWWYDCFCEGVDLNAYLVRECRAFSVIARLKGNKEDEKLFSEYADRIAQTMQKLMWDEEDGLFYDLDQRTGKRIRVKYIGIFAAMWAGVATREQAERMVYEHLMNPEEFLRGFPFPVLAATEKGYSNTVLPDDLGCCWRAQTWIPTNYYVFHALRDYGYKDLAAFTAYTTYRYVKAIGDREYYNTELKTGNGLDPFWGWSLLAYFMPIEQQFGYFPDEITEEQMDFCSYKQFLDKN